jgi:hypothetical protein
MKLKCDACGRKYTEEEAGKLKVLTYRMAPSIKAIRVFCTCGHVLDVGDWKNEIETK